MLPPLSARRFPQPEQSLAPQFSSHRSLNNASFASSASFRDLSVRRKAAIKKSFKRLDPLGTGAVKLQDALQTLALAPILTANGQRELTARFNSLATPGVDGNAVLSFAAFMSYYVEVSAGINSESDFEQLLEAHWGYFEVSDILAAFQRQLTLTGLSVAFKDFSQSGHFADVNTREFDACLKRVGLLLRAEDLQRVFGAFFQPGPGGGLGLADLKEQLVNPRPETPVPPMRNHGPFSDPVSTISTGRSLTNGTSTLSPRSLQPLSSAPRPQQEHAVIHQALGQMQAELHELKTKAKRGAPTGSGAVNDRGDSGPPANNADLEAAVSRLEGNLHSIKTHKAKVDAAANQPPPAALYPVDMPHWDHHKYGHHEIAEPAWRPDKSITDMNGQQHDASEYQYNASGAGSHGHHLAHYHLNDYHGLAHDSFKAQEYQKQTHGDASHHGHWVPHLHGIGTASHQGEHGCSNEDYSQDYQKHASGSSDDHSHWVPNLHELGGTG